MERLLDSRPDAAKFRWRALLTIIICYAGVGLISQFVLRHNSLRLDESQSLWQTSHTVTGLLRVVALDVHVPLYHLLLHFWQLYFGSSVATARLMSLGFFLINIPVVYLLARRVLSVNWSLLAVIMFSFSPFMNWYGNEIRMYTLLALFATLSQYFYLRILQRQGGWIGYLLTAVIGAYTHYFFMFNLAVQGLYFLYNRRRFAKGSFLRFAAIYALTIAALTPWLLYFHALGSGKNSSPALVQPSSIDFFNAFSQFSFGFQNDHINTIILASWPLLVVASLLAVRRRQQLGWSMGFIMTNGLGPIILAYGLSYVVKPFFISRYMISCVPPLTVLTVWFISYYRRRLATLVILLLAVFITLLSVHQASDFSTPVKEDYRDVAQQIQQQASPSDEVVISTPFTIYPFEYYYQGQAQIQTLPLWDRRSAGAIPGFNAKALPAQVAELNKGHRNVYLVLSYNQGYEKTILQYYTTHFHRLSATAYSHDLNLYVFRVGYDTAVPLAQLPSTMRVQAAAPTTSNTSANLNPTDSDTTTDQ